MSLAGENMSVPEISDFAQRYVVDRFSAVDGVARVRIGGEQRYAMRVWLDKNQLAAHNLTVNDIEAALRAEKNVNDQDHQRYGEHQRAIHLMNGTINKNCAAVTIF